MRELSKVEQAFYKESGNRKITTPATYVIVDNFPKLGLLSALSFLEWAGEHPEGVISLPTSKTAQHFLKYTRFLLESWDHGNGKELLEKYGLADVKKPDLRGLHFVQAGEFYPISPAQHNSLWNYADKYYIREFGLDPSRALMINSDEIPLAGGRSYEEVFPEYKIDLSFPLQGGEESVGEAPAAIHLHD